MAVNRVWEVMNSCVTMHNMIVESEHTSLVKDDHPYDCQGSLDKVDYQPTFEIFSPYITKSMMNWFINNFKMI
jgi:hypothetical protein